MSSDLARALANLIRKGTVQSVTTRPARARVQVGGLLTAPLPWLSLRACTNKVRHWSPPAAGEQVLVFSPGGDLGGGVVLCGIPSDKNPIPDDATEDNVMMVFGDGAVLLYDLASHVLRGTLPDGGRVEVSAPGGFLLTGDTVIDGNLTVNKDVEMKADAHAAGTITGDTDVVFAGISSKGHKHKDTQPGQGFTGDPVGA
ncbi:phage baseplate assembly protein V [Luteibacter sp. NPDC031894]|uniref:phage baseplate assembly protein V n=1 Tax=Luteibacter sp. NPDC031894 TaxID=3390572 RepID=UPI003D0485FF